MPHEDFFEATLIEFTEWKNDHETVIAKYNGIEELPSHLKDELQKHSSKMYFRGKEWNILQINRDLRAHGKGMHVKVRLEKI